MNETDVLYSFLIFNLFIIIPAAARSDYPKSFVHVPLLLPTHHSAARLGIDRWLERERIKPLIAREFESNALYMTFAAKAMGVLPCSPVARK